MSHSFFESSDYQGAVLRAIQAGVNPYEFYERVDRINEMYPYEPEEE